MSQIWQLLKNYANGLWLQEISSKSKSLKTATFFSIGKKDKSVKFFQDNLQKVLLPQRLQKSLETWIKPG
ncbi:hypothetical protein VB735_23395 [Halotia wernerae UHCC 0503]|nr:hypothetical protein [Halotia wernerae UHCC 0503]